MKIKNAKHISFKKNKGASMIEYTLGLSILVIAISVIEIPGTGKSAIGLLEQALKEESSAYSESMAYPR